MSGKMYFSDAPIHPILNTAEHRVHNNERYLPYNINSSKKYLANNIANEMERIDNALQVAGVMNGVFSTQHGYRAHITKNSPNKYSISIREHSTGGIIVPEFNIIKRVLPPGIWWHVPNEVVSLIHSTTYMEPGYEFLFEYKGNNYVFSCILGDEMGRRDFQIRCIETGRIMKYYELTMA